MWTIDTKDWTRPGIEFIRDSVVDDIRPGGVILMHDGGGSREQTVRATRQMIRALKKEGYRFVTVEELYQRTL
jgi:peptidoglycan/xylan/chitin deacetylase (PgdA/CDA1 family)